MPVVIFDGLEPVRVGSHNDIGTMVDKSSSQSLLFPVGLISGLYSPVTGSNDDVTVLLFQLIYEAEALALVNRLFAQGHETLVMCGGSMLYIDAFCYGLDDFPEVPLQLREHLMECLKEDGVESLAEQLKELDPVSYESLDLSNGQRVIRALEVSMYTGQPLSSFKTNTFKKRDFEIVKIGLERPREQLYERINARVLEMMRRGLEAEARRMLPYRDLPALQTVGYKEMFDYFDGGCTREEAVRRIQVNSRHYAKRQLTWWRRDEEIRWIPAE